MSDLLREIILDSAYLLRHDRKVAMDELARLESAVAVLQHERDRALARQARLSSMLSKEGSANVNYSDIAARAEREAAALQHERDEARRMLEGPDRFGQAWRKAMVAEERVRVLEADLDEQMERALTDSVLIGGLKARAEKAERYADDDEKLRERVRVLEARQAKARELAEFALRDGHAGIPVVASILRALDADTPEEDA